MGRVRARPVGQVLLPRPHLGASRPAAAKSAESAPHRLPPPTAPLARLSLHPNTKRHAPRNARRNFSPGADCASQALIQTTLTGRKKTLQAPIRPKRSRPNCAKLSVNSPPKSMEEPRRHVHPHRSRCGRADLRLRCGSPSFSRGRRRTRTGSSRLHPGRLGRCRRWCRPAGTPASSSTAI